MPITLSSVVAQLDNLNPRKEFHGEEKKLAIDLQISFNCPNTFLEQLDVGLLSFLYKPLSADMDLITPAGTLAELRYPMIGKISHGYEGEGYKVGIEYGVTGNDFLLCDAGVNKFRVEFKEGGSIKVSFRIQAHPSPETVGRLCELIGNEITLSLTPPAANPDVLGAAAEESAATGGGKSRKGRKSKDEQAAEALQAAEEAFKTEESATQEVAA